MNVIPQTLPATGIELQLLVIAPVVKSIAQVVRFVPFPIYAKKELTESCPTAVVVFEPAIVKLVSPITVVPGVNVIVHDPPAGIELHVEALTEPIFDKSALTFVAAVVVERLVITISPVVEPFAGSVNGDPEVISIDGGSLDGGSLTAIIALVFDVLVPNIIISCADSWLLNGVKTKLHEARGATDTQSE